MTDPSSPEFPVPTAERFNSARFPASQETRLQPVPADDRADQLSSVRRFIRNSHRPSPTPPPDKPNVPSGLHVDFSFPYSDKVEVQTHVIKNAIKIAGLDNLKIVPSLAPLRSEKRYKISGHSTDNSLAITVDIFRLRQDITNPNHAAEAINHLLKDATRECIFQTTFSRLIPNWEYVSEADRSRHRFSQEFFGDSPLLHKTLEVALAYGMTVVFYVAPIYAFGSELATGILTPLRGAGLLLFPLIVPELMGRLTRSANLDVLTPPPILRGLLALAYTYLPTSHFAKPRSL